MKLDKTLNFKKVRCVKGYDDCLKIGKEYDVIDISVEIKVKDDRGELLYWESDHFEPVVDDELPKSAKNPLQNIELTPEFEVDNSVNIQDIGTDILDTNADIKDTPKFEVGDKVYFGVNPKIQTVESVHAYNNIKFIGTWGCAYARQCCHATQENYERLQATFPDIEFEQPPKELKGSDLCRAMLEKGWKYVPCYVHDGSDDEAINRKHYVSVKNETPRSGYNFSGTGANDWKYAVPIDPRTGEPLTESVLDE